MARSRLRRLVAAGLVDSFGLALGWTTFNLYAVAHGGLDLVGFYGAALLVGVALSAPVASSLCRRLCGRRLLRSTAIVEALLRVASLAALVAGAPALLVAGAVMLYGVAAWTGFAAMRAEVVAAGDGPGAITRYMGLIAAVEAGGVAAASLLPAKLASTLTGPAFDVVLAVYALSLIPTFVVARGAQVGKAPSVERRRQVHDTRELHPLLGGFLVMAAGSGPTLLAVGVAAQLYGRSAVAVSAAAFTVGALLAPAAIGLLERRRWPARALWPALGMGMAGGWVLAPQHLAGLVAAQLFSGLALSAFEGAMDTRVAREKGTPRTADLAKAAAARALGSAVALSAAPQLIDAFGLTVFSAFAGALLAVAAVVAAGGALLRRNTAREAEASVPKLAAS